MCAPNIRLQHEINAIETNTAPHHRQNSKAQTNYFLRQIVVLDVPCLQRHILKNLLRGLNFLLNSQGLIKSVLNN